MKTLLYGLILLAASGLVSAATPPSGTYLTVDQLGGAQRNGYLIAVNPNTGARTLLQNFNDPAQGVTAVDPNGISWVPAGLLFVPPAIFITDGSGGTHQRGALYHVDPRNGTRSLHSDFGNSNQGPLGFYPEDVMSVSGVLGLTHSILVADPMAGTDYRGALFQVDAQGNRRIFVDFGDGNGPLGVYPNSMAWLPGLLGLPIGGTILVADSSAGTRSLGALFAVNPATGDRRILSDFGNPAQGWTASNLLSGPVAVIASADGRIFVLDAAAGTDERGALVKVNAITGQRTLISDFGNTSQGPEMRNVDPTAMTWSFDGSRVLVLDGSSGTNSKGALFSVHPSTGVRQLVSDYGTPQLGVIGEFPSAIETVR